MRKIELICIGDIKFAGLKELEKEYLKRISYFSDFRIKNLSEVKSKSELFIRKKEAEQIRLEIKGSDFVVALDRKGKKMDSRQFAAFLSEKMSYHTGRIVFVIGGFTGLSEVLDECIDFKLSFSELTFAHDIFRIVFLEQLYRSFTITKGMQYHR